MLIHANVVLGGINMSAGDIAFSYDGPLTVFGSATVGLNQGSGGGFIYAPGHSSNTSTESMLVDHAATNQFYLFRKAAPGQYSAELVPEPASFVVVGIGLAGLALARRRK